MVLTERDRKILIEMLRWRFLLARQIKVIGVFNSNQSLYRRLRKLLDFGYIRRIYYLYGVPAIYTATTRGIKTASLDICLSPAAVNPAQIRHDAAVIDTALYLMLTAGINLSEMLTERELRHANGYGPSTHVPDIVIPVLSTSYEIELTLKGNTRLEKNIADAFARYNRTVYVIPHSAARIKGKVQELAEKYPSIEILDLEEVEKIVKQ
jgi:hypothetical protein